MRTARTAGQFFLVPKLRLGTHFLGETLCRWRDAGRGWTRSRGNRVAGTGAFPNGVWERGENEGRKGRRSLRGILQDAVSWSRPVGRRGARASSPLEPASGRRPARLLLSTERRFLLPPSTAAKIQSTAARMAALPASQTDRSGKDPAKRARAAAGAPGRCPPRRAAPARRARGRRVLRPRSTRRGCLRRPTK